MRFSGNSGMIFGMARTADFKINNLGKYFYISIPSSLTENGKRERRIYKTKTLAEAAQKMLKGNLRENGTGSVTLPSSVVIDTKEAMKILEKFPDIKLATVAKFYVRHHDAKSKCPTLNQAFDESLKRRQNHSESYQRSIRELRNRLPDELLETNVYDINGEDITQAIDDCCGGLTMWKNAFVTLRAVLGDQVKSNRIKTNPCENVHVPKNRRKSAVVIYTPKQVDQIFQECRKLSEGRGKDCSDCTVAFALLFFAGIRPVELTRIQWENINGDFIRLSSEVTKTPKTRNVHISKTLKAWLNTVPKEKREGKFIPADWTKKAGRVKKAAGICGKKYQDAARHTYGSFTVALEGIDYVRATMGHGHTATFETSYNSALTIPQAKQYMKIMPLKKATAKKAPAKTKKKLLIA